MISELSGWFISVCFCYWPSTICTSLARNSHCQSRCWSKYHQFFFNLLKFIDDTFCKDNSSSKNFPLFLKSIIKFFFSFYRIVAWVRVIKPYCTEMPFYYAMQTVVCFWLAYQVIPERTNWLLMLACKNLLREKLAGGLSNRRLNKDQKEKKSELEMILFLYLWQLKDIWYLLLYIFTHKSV